MKEKIIFLNVSCGTSIMQVPIGGEANVPFRKGLREYGDPWAGRITAELRNTGT